MKINRQTVVRLSVVALAAAVPLLAQDGGAPGAAQINNLVNWLQVYSRPLAIVAIALAGVGIMTGNSHDGMGTFGKTLVGVAIVCLAPVVVNAFLS